MTTSSTRAAELIAHSPQVAKLKFLSFKNCRIGHEGRRALGASPYLSDKVKASSKALIIARNEEAVASPPSPRDTFGDLRSILQQPASEHAWNQLTHLLDRLNHSPERDRFTQETLPYVHGSLSTWPDELRVAPLSWLEAIMDGDDAQENPALALATTIHPSS
jgi:hypothetical protein